jgi:hypothetical protein
MSERSSSIAVARENRAAKLLGAIKDAHSVLRDYDRFPPGIEREERRQATYGAILDMHDQLPTIETYLPPQEDDKG